MRTIKLNSTWDYHGIEWTSRVVDFGISLMVGAALNELITSEIHLEDTPLFKGIVKHNARRAVREASARQIILRQSAGDGKLYESYSGAVIDAARNDINLFRIAIKQVLDEHNIPYSGIKAEVECARCLLEMSVIALQDTIRIAEHRYLKDFGKYFQEFDIKRIRDIWTLVCNDVYKGWVIDLNTPTVKALFDSMLVKFSEGKYINECLEQAYDENPDKRPN